MKKLIFFALIFGSISSMAQKITDLPVATGQGIGGVTIVVQNGVTKKIPIDSISATSKKYADSLKAVLVIASNANAGNIATNTTAIAANTTNIATNTTNIAANTTAITTKQPTLVSGSTIKTIDGLPLLGAGDIATKLDTSTIYLKLNQNAGAIGGKQNNLVTGLNSPSINGIALANNPQNILIAGASSKSLYKDITVTPGTTTIWNFDSSSTAKITTNGTVNIDIAGSIPAGSTGVLVVTQSASGNDTLKYNGTVINIGKIANKTSFVGFIKLANTFVFSVDTIGLVVAQTSSVAIPAGSYDADATTLFTAASTNTSYKDAVNAAIVSLKGITLAAGGTAWSKSVMINGRAGTNLTQQSFNWKNPAKYNYTYNGTFTYATQGTQFSGSNFIGTGLIPSRDFTGVSTDLSMISVIGLNPTPGGLLLGGLDLTANVSLYLETGANIFGYAFGTGEIPITTTPIGRFVTFYSDPTTLKSYKNGTLLDSRVVAPATNLFSIEMLEGGGNANGTPSYFSTGTRVDVTQIINSKLTVAEAQAIDAVWATYQTALSR